MKSEKLDRKGPRRLAIAGISGIVLAASMVLPSVAQTEFPEPGRPITLVQNFAPGGTIQKAMQDFQPFFEEELGTRVEVETIEGAAGLIGYNEVFKRPADGYTIIGASSTFGPHIYPHLSETPPPWTYDDFLPLGIYSDIPNSGMVVLKDSPYKTFPDLIEAARANPGSITIGTIGPGRIEDIQILELQEFFGVKLNHVYYDSGGTLFTDLLTGDLDIIITAALQYADNPDVRILTLLAKEMTDTFPFPDTPIIADWQDELKFNVNDLKTLVSTHYNGLMVKAGLPDDVYQRLVVAFKNVVTNPEWKERVKDYRFPVYYTPEEAKAIYDNVNEGIADMMAVVKENKSK